MFCKNAVLKNFAIFTGKQLCWILFLIKLQAFSPAILLKGDSSTGVFLCISRIFQEHLFWKTSANGCFWLISNFSILFVFGCLFTIIKKNYDPLWRKCSVKSDYQINQIRLIQWRIFLKGILKLLKYTCWSLMYLF